MKADPLAQEINLGQASMRRALPDSVAYSRNFNRPGRRVVLVVGY